MTFIYQATHLKLFHTAAHNITLLVGERVKDFMKTSTQTLKFRYIRGHKILKYV